MFLGMKYGIKDLKDEEGIGKQDVYKRSNL